MEVFILSTQIDKSRDFGYNVGIQTDGVDAMAFDQTKYIDDYVKENYDRVVIKIPKGKKSLLKQIATEKNITDFKGQVSVTRMIIEAIEGTYHIDLSKPE